MAKIGIMGGTFDPIHYGHLLIGRQAKEEYQLDQVWFMPSGQPPHKQNHPVTEAKIRWKMAKLALEEEKEPAFFLSDFEIQRSGNTYTAQTLTQLNEQYSNHCFYFIVGADSLYEIEHWYHPEQVMKQSVLLVAEREYDMVHPRLERQIAYLKDKYHADIFRLHCREVSISSEEIREMAAKGRPLNGLLPDAVREYIEQNQLYQRKAACFRKE